MTRGTPGNTTYNWVTNNATYDSNRPITARFEYDGWTVVASVKQTGETGFRTLRSFPFANLNWVFFPNTKNGTGAQQYSQFSLVSPTYNTLATLTYDSGHQPLTITDALNKTTTFTYNAAGQIKTLTDALGHTSTWVYDTDTTPSAPGYLLSFKNAANQTVVQYVYDTKGRVNLVTVGNGRQVGIEYDNLNRVTRRIHGDATDEVFTYADLDLVSYKDRLARTTLYDYNKLGQLTGVTDPLAHDTDITPCVGCAGNNEVNDPILHKTKYTRDIQNRITKEEPVPANTDRGTWARTYNINGYLQTLTDPAGPVATYAYDPAGRVTSIAYTGGTDNISYTYDSYTGCSNGIGKLCRVTDGAGSTVFDYDANQRLKSETRTEAGQTYVTTYNLDDAGRLTSLQAPTGLTLQMGLDDVGRALQLSAVLSGSTTPMQTTASYNGSDQLLYARFANNLTEQRSYDFDGRVSTIDVGLTDTDGDGMPDVWEQAYGLNPGNASDATLDPDSDGLTNAQEYLAGTNPFVADTDGDGLLDGQDPQPTVSTASWFVPLRQMLQ